MLLFRDLFWLIVDSSKRLLVYVVHWVEKILSEWGNPQDHVTSEYFFILFAIIINTNVIGKYPRQF